MKLGIDVLLEDRSHCDRLKPRRIALLGNPASMTGRFEHSLDALMNRGIPICAAFGPQHGMRGDKQDNMVESEDTIDPFYGIPVFSLYGKTRRLRADMLDCFDILLVDLQDLGCRIYTFLSTLFYLIEDCAASNKSLWILDRPNPAGRPIEGACLVPGHESFVGVAPMPMRHGLTLGEAARWYLKRSGLDLDLTVVAMADYRPEEAPGFGWPLHELPWVNPSPNIATLNAARVFSGTVLLEGTTISEGRGTTRALEVCGAPDLDNRRILERMQASIPELLQGCKIRPAYFEPTFHKHAGKLCRGFQIHTDHPDYRPINFKPYRIIAMFLKTIRKLSPDYPIWRDFPYEYVNDRLAIDVIDGGENLRTWVDDPQSAYADLDARLLKDETSWREESRPFRMYG
ncbi:MAG: exo-beta-N-acetylmuramidase NamZ family protein [Gammaproteobacteria bacterium]